MGDDEAEQLAHLSRCELPQHAAARRRRAVARDQGRRPPDAAIDQRRHACRELERTDRDPVAERHRGDGDVAPARGDQGAADFRQFDGRRLEHPEPAEELALRLGAESERHFGRADIRRIHEDLGHRQPPLLGVVVVDGEARETQRLRGVVTVGQGHVSGIERHRDGERLQGRPRFENAERGAVEAGVGVPRAAAVGVERRDADEGEQFGAVDIEDQRRRALCREARHGLRNFVVNRVLEPQVDAQRQRGFRHGAQPLIEMRFDSRQPAVVDAGEAHRMADQIRSRVKPSLGRQKGEARLAELVDGMDLARRQQAPDPDETPVARQFADRGAGVDIGQKRGEADCRGFGVHDPAGVGVKRMGRRRRGDQFPVPVHDVGALRPRRDERPARRAGVGIRAQHGDIHQAGGDDRKAEREQRDPADQPRADGLHRPAARRFGSVRNRDHGSVPPPAARRGSRPRATVAVASMGARTRCRDAIPARRPGSFR